MKKKILSVIIVAAMTVTLVACGASPKEVATTTEPEVVETTQNDDVVSDTDSEAVMTLSAEGISVDGEIGEANTVTVNDVDESNYSDLTDYITDKSTDIMVKDFKLANDAGDVQPSGTVNVSIDVSTMSTDGNNYVVYYVANDGSFEKMDSSVNENVVTFKTTHFSIYAIVQYDDTTITEDNFVKTSADIVEESTESEITESSDVEVPVETPKTDTPAYTVTDMSKTMYAKQTVNVRSGPSTDYDKLGGLSQNQEVTVTGQADTGWYRINYNGGEAFVSNSYLVNEKVEVAQSTETSNNGGNNGDSKKQSSSWIDNYEMFTWYDMGDYFFMIFPGDWGVQQMNPYINSDNNIYNTVQSRYPDYDIACMGACSKGWKDGKWHIYMIGTSVSPDGIGHNWASEGSHPWD